jgi:hypothetical protein
MIRRHECIDVPRPIDALMEREKLAQSHSGNIRYQFLIDEYQERYETCETRIDKTITIASAIVMKVKEYGGRFLSRKKEETNWSEPDDSLGSRKSDKNVFRGR